VAGAKQAKAAVRARRVSRSDAFALGLFAGLAASVIDRAPWRTVSPPASPAVASLSRAAPRAGFRASIFASIKAFNEDRIPTAAAAVTFYALLALFPALSAFVSLYGLFADVGQARRQIVALSGLLPGGAVKVLGEQMTRFASADHGRLGLAFAVSLLVSIWSANAGVKALIQALNVAFETRERRNFLQLNLLSLGFTAGLLLLSIAAVAVIAAASGVLARVGLSGLPAGPELRWPAFLILTGAVFALLYRFGPSRTLVRWRWVTPGACLAAVSWVAMSALFSTFVANFGHYDQTYGSLGAIVGFLTWIWLSLMVLLFGAEVNAAFERRDRANGPQGGDIIAPERGQSPSRQPASVARRA
jgi:membrane protein